MHEIKISSKNKDEISYVKFLVYMTLISVANVGILGFEKEAMGIILFFLFSGYWEGRAPCVGAAFKEIHMRAEAEIKKEGRG
jgi:hypothetical protein